MNLYGKEPAMNYSHAFNAEDSLLFTPKAMDSLFNSVLLLAEDAKAFIEGKPDYYRLICCVALDNIVPRTWGLYTGGLDIAGLWPKAVVPCAADVKVCLERCYADAIYAHNLLWELYDFNAYNDRTRAELDNLAKNVLYFLQRKTIELSVCTCIFRDTYQLPMDFIPYMRENSSPTLFICGECSQAFQDKEPQQAEAWVERLISDYTPVHEAFIAEHPSWAAIHWTVG